MAGKKAPSFDPHAFLSRVDGGRTITEYHKNEWVYRQGESADAVFYLQTGRAKVSVVSEQGKEAVVAFLSMGDFFGEGALGGQLLRLASVVALNDCVVTCIPKAEVLRVIHEEPAFAELFISHLLARNSRIEEDLVDQLFNSSEKRLARTLLLLANFGKEGEPEPILARISQETLAEMIGTTRSRVSYFMNKFRRMGLIDYNGHIEVHRSLLNVVLHEIPELKAEADREGPIASVERCPWQVGFTPDSRRVAASQRNDAMARRRHRAARDQGARGMPSRSLRAVYFGARPQWRCHDAKRREAVTGRCAGPWHLFLVSYGSRRSKQSRHQAPSLHGYSRAKCERVWCRA